MDAAGRRGYTTIVHNLQGPRWQTVNPGGTIMQSRSRSWAPLGGALLLLAGVVFLLSVDGPSIGAVQDRAPIGTTGPQPPPPAEAAKSQRAKALPTRSAHDRVIVQPAASIPAPDQVPDCIFVPSPRKIVDAMLELAKVQPGEVVFDLGSGDGRVCIAAAKKYGTRAFGYEIQADLVTQSLEDVKKNKLEHLVTIERRDIFKLDLSGADVVTFWLMPALNVRLIPQLEKMKPGARIVSHAFDMSNIIKPDRVIDVEDDLGIVRPLYLWKVPFKKDDKLYREYLRRHPGVAK
jgi:Methyltransferase domain